MMEYTLTAEEAALYESGQENLEALRRMLVRRFGPVAEAGRRVKVEVYHPEGFVIEAYAGGGEEV